jgi:hypothetical protein
VTTLHDFGGVLGRPLNTFFKGILNLHCKKARQRHFPDVRTANCPNPPVNHDNMITAPALTPHRPVFLYSFPESGFSTIQLVNEGYGGNYEVALYEEGENFLQRGRAAGVPELLVHLARP